MARASFFVALFFATAVYADEPIKIPLKEIWGYRLPGTTEISDKEEKPQNATPAELLRFDRESLVNQIKAQLGKRQRGQIADNAFCVAGTGLDALKAASAVIVGHEKPKQQFANGTEISLVFFAHLSPKFVELIDVERDGTHIQVRYRFKFHMQTMMSTNFALIPLGKLPPGKYTTKFVQLPIVSDEPADHPEVGKLENDDWIISKPSSLFVREE